MRLAPWLSVFATSVAMWACAPQAALPPQSPAAADAPKSDWKQVEPAKQKVPLVAEPVGLPPADPSCQEYLSHKSDTCKPPPPSRDAAREALAQALSTPAPLERDALLSCLESDRNLPPGLLRALRAELAPLGCADVIALPFLEPRRPELERSMEDALIALASAGRLARLVRHAPEISGPFDKPHFMDFFQSTLKPWIVAQAQAIHELSLSAAQLSSYAKGVVAIEAGLADMRFVSVVRQVALPKEMSDDAEVREAYYAALDEALEPRKARGRDAALVGLRELSSVGVLVDARVERARSLLSEVYAGRRIDALDKLLLPALAPALDDTTERKLAQRLPTFYSGFLLADSALDAPLLRALLERGLPRSLSARVEPSTLDDASRDLFVRAADRAWSTLFQSRRLRARRSAQQQRQAEPGTRALPRARQQSAKRTARRERVDPARPAIAEGHARGDRAGPLGRRKEQSERAAGRLRRGLFAGPRPAAERCQVLAGARQTLRISVANPERSRAQAAGSRIEQRSKRHGSSTQERDAQQVAQGR